MRLLPRLIPLLVLAIPVAGCVYRMPIQQGNILNPDQVQQIQVGMTRTQVSYVLGTPMVPPSFNNDRWDYYLLIKDRRLQAPVQQRMTIWFEDEKVARIEKEHLPENPPPAAPEAPTEQEKAAALAEPAAAGDPPSDRPPATLAPSAESTAAGAANESVHQ